MGSHIEMTFRAEVAETALAVTKKISSGNHI
jgi:hypothetical protein